MSEYIEMIGETFNDSIFAKGRALRKGTKKK